MVGPKQARVRLHLVFIHTGFDSIAPVNSASLFRLFPLEGINDDVKRFFAALLLLDVGILNKTTQPCLTLGLAFEAILKALHNKLGLLHLPFDLVGLSLHALQILILGPVLFSPHLAGLLLAALHLPFSLF